MDHGNPPDVLIAGGGVAALEAALALRALGEGGIRVELLAPEPQFWYRPLAVAEPFALGEVRHFDLAELAAEAGATLSYGRLVSVDAARHIAYTASGGAVSYSMLLIACGAAPRPAVDGALTFRGPADTERIEHLLAEIEAGEVRRVAFAVPAGAVWSLPVYELVLLTAGWLAARGMDHVKLALVTPEVEPLHLFGDEPSAAVRALLEEREIAVHTQSYPAEAREGELLLVGGDVLPADRVVALPRLQGQRIGGVAQTFEGFIPVDPHGRVIGTSDVYAAGDITTFTVKQGGLAAQQAEAAAESIAAASGVGIEPRPFRPVLRGLLLTGDGPQYLHGELTGGAGIASAEPLWWPPAKIVGRYLAPFLAQMTGTAVAAEPEPGTAVPVEVELDATDAEQRRDRLMAAAVDEALHETAPMRVGDLMTTDTVVVAPEDTIGEVAERMTDVDTGSALVAEYGRLIGIITSRDMLRALAGRVHSSEARVRQWMTADPIVVSPATTVEAASVLMIGHRIHHLPVVEGERPVGTIVMRDVVRAQHAPMRLGLGF
jgi:sulfide:quinone oxidoreductase